MSGPDAIAKQFVDFYYNQFDNDRSQLASLYRESSMLSWESSPFQGSTAIVEKLTTLPFQKVLHKVSTIDAQPSSPTVASLLVSVSGLLVVDDSEHPLQFSQVFQLIPDGGSYYVLNDIFRLIYG
ncbi:nuclear transport factor 2 [Sistotremastrum suecicum HHB10207 ss-3]|uniref:Nuclear transport factor 2 n=1 Tax=Sistotremastrum suecicum HHB10207 ss-3 TaxID=1314776 RepID=A0A166IYW9_9AGAM|nr:nuclear transport factor 2 [Sistotremastrum suecicum HHB10207 ss-3]